MSRGMAPDLLSNLFADLDQLRSGAMVSRRGLILADDCAGSSAMGTADDCGPNILKNRSRPEKAAF